MSTPPEAGSVDLCHSISEGVVEGNVCAANNGNNKPRVTYIIDHYLLHHMYRKDLQLTGVPASHSHTEYCFCFSLGSHFIHFIRPENPVLQTKMSQTEGRSSR